MQSELALRKQGVSLLAAKRRMTAGMIAVVVVVGLLAIAGAVGGWYLLHRARTHVGVCFDPKLKLQTTTMTDGLQIRAVGGVPAAVKGFCWELEPVYNKTSSTYTSARVKLAPCDPSNPAQLFSSVGPAARTVADGSHYNWWHLQNSLFEAVPPANTKDVPTLAKQIACAQQGKVYGKNCDGSAAVPGAGVMTSLWQLVTPCAEQQSTADGGACPPGQPCQMRFADPSYYSTVGFQPCTVDALSPQGHYTGAAAEFAFDVRDAANPCAFELTNLNPNEDKGLQQHATSVKLGVNPQDDPFRQPRGAMSPVIGADGYLVWGKPGTQTWAFVNPRITNSQEVQDIQQDNED